MMTLFMIWTSFHMSVIHFNSQMKLLIGGRGPPHCMCHFSSQLLIGGGILHISNRVKDTSSGGWDSPHFTARQSHINGGVGILHISHPVEVTLWGGWVISSTFHNQSKSHHPGVGGILHISPTKHLSSETKLTFIAICPAQLKLVPA